jgi:hypothetical protein
MKITKTYPGICSHCQGNGFIQPVQGQITSTNWSNVCPVCNGAKTIIITETTEESSQSSQAEVTDAEIEKEFPVNIGDSVFMERNTSYDDLLKMNIQRRIGARWFRSRQQQNLREELVKYDMYLDKQLSGESNKLSSERCIDEYLKSK